MHKNFNNCYQVISFYRFINIKNPLVIKELIINLDQVNNIQGTIIISKEGINGSVFGSKSILNKFFEMINIKEPVIFDCRVDPNENCYPMIPSGKPHNQMLLGPEDEKEEVTDEGKTLV